MFLTRHALYLNSSLHVSDAQVIAQHTLSYAVRVGAHISVPLLTDRGVILCTDVVTVGADVTLSSWFFVSRIGHCLVTGFATAVLPNTPTTTLGSNRCGKRMWKSRSQASAAEHGVRALTLTGWCIDHALIAHRTIVYSVIVYSASTTPPGICVPMTIHPTLLTSPVTAAAVALRDVMVNPTPGLITTSY